MSVLCQPSFMLDPESVCLLVYVQSYLSPDSADRGTENQCSVISNYTATSLCRALWCLRATLPLPLAKLYSHDGSWSCVTLWFPLSLPAHQTWIVAKNAFPTQNLYFSTLPSSSSSVWAGTFCPSLRDM